MGIGIPSPQDAEVILSLNDMFKNQFLKKFPVLAYIVSRSIDNYDN